jgi:hypothetical protein
VKGRISKYTSKEIQIILQLVTECENNCSEAARKLKHQGINITAQKVLYYFKQYGKK